MSFGASFSEQLHEVVLRSHAAEGAFGSVLHLIEHRFADSGVLLYRFVDSTRLEPLGGRLREIVQRSGTGWLEDDPCQTRARSLSHEVFVHPSRLVSRQTHVTSEAYRVFYGPHALEHLMCMRFDELPHGSAGNVGLLMARSESARDFDDAAIAAVHSARPVLTALRLSMDRLARAQLLLAATAEAIEDESPVILLSTSGDVLVSSRRAKAMLLGLSLRKRDTLLGQLRDAVLQGQRHWLAPVGVENWSTLLQAHPDMPNVIVARLRPALDAEARLAARYRLTPTESAVLGCLGQGMSNADIGVALNISIATAATHVKHLLLKLRLDSRLKAGLLMQYVDLTGELS